MAGGRKWLPVAPGAWVLLFTLIGFGLRVQRLNFQPLWGDEGWSFYFAAQPVGQLLALTAVDIHPPLYYLLLKLWLVVTGVGPVPARLLSVAAGTLLIPVAAALGRRLFDWRRGVAAAVVITVMPLAVYYSQEVRMYGLVTLLAALSMYFFVAHRRRLARSPGYLLATAAALYTMYYAAFVVLAQLGYALAQCFQSRRRSWRDFGAALMPFALVGLLYLPWLVYAAPKLVNYISHKRAVEGYASLNLVRFTGDHLVAFGLGHLPPDFQPYVWAALPALILAALGARAAWQSKYKPAALLFFYLLVPLLAGYLVNRLYPFTPRFFERTLLLAAPAYWLLIGAGLIWLWERQYWLVGTAAAAMVTPAAVSLISFYTLPRYPNEDYRPLLRDVAAMATPADTILASYQWQMGFYQAYLPPPRPQVVEVPGWGAGWSAQAGNAARLRHDLAAILAQSPRLWFPAYQAGGHIWEDEAEAALAELGFPALLKWYSPEIKLTLAAAPQAPLAAAPGANFGGKLTLLAAQVGGGSFAAGRDIVPVALTWRKDDTLGSEHLVSLRLVDAAGRTWATRDSHPRAGQVFFTDISPGDTLTDRHGLLTPAGAPPGAYRLLLSVRRASDAHPLDLWDAAGQPAGVELQLAEITLVTPQPPVGVAALPMQTTVNADFGGQARLVGYSLGDGPFKAGESLPLTLFWQAVATPPGPLTVQVDLQNAAGQTVFSTAQPPLWPATAWQPGDLLRDPHAVLLPPTLPPGQYRLALSLLDANQQKLAVNGGNSLPLPAITTTDRPHIFKPPAWKFTLNADFNGQARLVGLDLPVTKVAPGESVPVTLYWQALAPFDKNWTVFVHLTAAGGQLLSQQDQPPGGGQFPTTGWVPNEYLIDPYTLQIPANAAPGQYILSVGLYDVNDFSRLPVVDQGKITGDHVTLESWPVSVE